MLNSSESANRIRRYNVPIRVLRSDFRDKRGIAHEESVQAARPDAAGAHLLPHAMPSAADRPEPPFWSSVIWYFMEGFALYGAAMHPTACFPAICDSEEKKTPQTEEFALRERRKVVSLVLPAASRGAAGGLERDSNQTAPAGSEAAFAERGLREFDAVRSSHGRSNGWKRLTSSWHVVVAPWAHWRREREIKKTVIALAKFDDRTLRRIGIPQRSQIEQVVRYCRDC